MTVVTLATYFVDASDLNRKPMRRLYVHEDAKSFGIRTITGAEECQIRYKSEMLSNVETKTMCYSSN